VKCTICESLKDLMSKLGKNSNEALEYEAKLRKHIIHQKSFRNLYHTWRTKSMRSKDEFLCIIHDKMDYAKTMFSRLQVCNKMTFGLGQSFVTLTGMIVHGHGDENMHNILMNYCQTIPISQLGPCYNCCGLWKRP
jgi:hypothetical protein